MFIIYYISYIIYKYSTTTIYIDISIFLFNIYIVSYLIFTLFVFIK